ncbi:MAG TPA: hypothetical protein PK264_10275 [Hyphomicrobiaceae bacterium]|nr:hypothetical protein [Hyphomicrobiaceae bacterium]
MRHGDIVKYSLPVQLQGDADLKRKLQSRQAVILDQLPERVRREIFRHAVLGYFRVKHHGGLTVVYDNRRLLDASRWGFSKSIRLKEILELNNVEIAEPALT